MKKLMLACALLCSITAATAQYKQAVQLGIGFGGTVHYAGGYKGSPAVSFAYEHLLPMEVGPGRIGVGAIGAYQTSKYDGAGYESKWNNALVALRGTYHLTKFLPEKLDAYGVAQLGVRFETNKYESGTGENRITAKDKYTRVQPALLVGARYYFVPQFAAFSELGYDLTVIKIGVAARF
jgi:hypothetical protein